MHKSCVYTHKTFMGCTNTGPIASLGKKKMKEKISYQIVQKNLTLEGLTLIQEKESE